MHTDLNPLAEQPPPLPKPVRLFLGENLEVFAHGTHVTLQVKAGPGHLFHLSPMEAKEVMVALGSSVAVAEANEWDGYDAGDAPEPDAVVAAR